MSTYNNLKILEIKVQQENCIKINFACNKNFMNTITTLYTEIKEHERPTDIILLIEFFKSQSVVECLLETCIIQVQSATPKAATSYTFLWYNSV